MVTKNPNTEPGPDPGDSHSELDRIDEVLGRPRDPDAFAGYLERLWTMAGRRRVTFSVLTALFAAALVVAAVVAVRGDAGLDFGGDASFRSADAGGFDERVAGDATDRPDLSDADTALVDQAVAVTAGDGARVDRVVPDPDPAVFVVAPGAVRATLLTFRSYPAVALTGASGWYRGACLQATVVAPDGRPGAVTWVAAEVGGCGAVAGEGAVPVCVGDAVVIMPLGEVPAAPDGESGADGAGAVAVDVVGSIEGYETALVTTEVAVSRPVDDWPAAVADPGAVVRLGGVAGADEAATVDCLAS